MQKETNGELAYKMFCEIADVSYKTIADLHKIIKGVK